ncbi:mucin-16-like [Crocuta crocuta]
MVSSAFSEAPSRETPDSREQRSPGPTPSNTGHPFAPREPGSEGDTTLTTSVSLLSPASDLGDEVSGSSTSSVQRVTSPLTAGIPGSPERTEPNSAVTYPITPSNPAASTGSVSRAVSPLVRPSPSGEEMSGSELPVSTSPEIPGTPSLPTAGTLASEPSGGPGTFSITSAPGTKTSFSPSPSSAAEESGTPVFIPGEDSKKTLNPSVSPPETSDSRDKTALAFTSVPTQALECPRSREQHLPRKLSRHRSPETSVVNQDPCFYFCSRHVNVTDQQRTPQQHLAGDQSRI